MKHVVVVAPKELKEIAASIQDVATRLESNNHKCIQIAKASKKEFKGRKSLNLDIHLKFRVFRQEDIDEINNYLSEVKE